MSICRGSNAIIYTSQITYNFELGKIKSCADVSCCHFGTAVHGSHKTLLCLCRLTVEILKKESEITKQVDKDMLKCRS